MRLFLAINFEDSVVDRLITVREKLRRAARSGSFTTDNNLHLTLVFLGEVEESRIDDIKDILDMLETPLFTVNIGGYGTFAGRDGVTFWIGVEKRPELMELQGQLSKGLAREGFRFDNKSFVPHITLARRLVIGAFEDNSGINAEVRRVSLMRADLSQRPPRYTEIYGKNLKVTPYTSF